MKKIGLRHIMAALAVVALASLLTLIVVRINGLAGELERRTSSLVQEIRGNTAQSEDLTRNMLRLADDVNGIRRSLGLSQTSYVIGPGEDGDTGTQSDATAAEQAEYYDAVDVLIEHRRRQAFAAMVDEMSGLDPFTSRPELTLERTDPYIAVARLDGYPVFRLSYDAAAATVSVAPVSGAAATRVETASAAVSAISRGLSEEARRVEAVEAMERRLKSLESDRPLSSLLDEKLVVLAEAPDSGPAAELNVQRGGYVFLSIGIDPVSATYRFGDEAVTDFGALYDLLMRRVAALDSRTPEEKEVERLVQEVRTVAQTQAYQAYLGNKAEGLTISSEAREDSDYLYFDIRDRDGRKVGSLGILKHRGEIYLMDQDDVPLSSLRSLGSVNPDVKKNS